MTDSQSELDKKLTQAYQHEDARNFPDKVMSAVRRSPVAPAPCSGRWIAVAFVVASVCLAVAGAAALMVRPPVRVASTANDSDAIVPSERGARGPVVTLEIPHHELEQRLAKSDYLPADFVLLLGRLKNPHGRGASRTVELHIDRVLKGKVAKGKILTKDELPAFHCQGPVVASGIFPRNQQLLFWLTRKKGRWVIHELQKSSPRFMKVFEAVTGDNPARDLTPLVAPHGFDFETTEIIKLFGDPDSITPLLKQVVRQTPALLRPLRGTPGPSYDKHWQKRMKLVSQRLSPCLDILARFTKYNDPSVIDLILLCYPPLQDEGADSLRFTLNYHLATFCSTAKYTPEKLELDASQISSIRHIFIKEILGFGEKWSVNGSTACNGVATIADANVVRLLLKEQAHRPVVASHATLAGALNSIYASEQTAADTKREIAGQWLEIIQNLSAQDVGEHRLAESHASRFAAEIAGNLVRANLSHAQREIIRETYHTTQTPWVKSALAWQVEPPSPPADEAAAEAIAYQFGSAFVARYTQDAKPAADVTAQISAWDGPHMLKLSKAKHAEDIVRSLKDATIVDLTIAHTSLTPELLAAIGELRTLQTVMFHACELPNPAALAELSRLKKLTRLTISDTQLKSADADGAVYLAKLVSLKELYLDEAGLLEDSSLASLTALHNLQALRISSPRITEGGAGQLLSLKQLECIVLPRVIIDTAIVEKFKKRGVSVFPRHKQNKTGGGSKRPNAKVNGC